MIEHAQKHVLQSSHHTLRHNVESQLHLTELKLSKYGLLIYLRIPLFSIFISTIVEQQEKL